jgi:hypothetical protein
MDRNRKRTKTTLQMKLTEQDRKEIKFLAKTAFKVYVALLLTLGIMYISINVL